ncbi:Uncharacterised protein [Bordetella pertussis]|nr:Uncharacterised protein [Bordetella pertussis]
MGVSGRKAAPVSYAIRRACRFCSVSRTSTASSRNIPCATGISDSTMV